ncbi:MAG: tRNA (adenosine(37)-N6)-dimethylallyltransferase MiaA [Cytophagales bacterium]
MNIPILVIIVGPTAVGKTALGIQLAKKYNSVVISADSRQFYKEMNIGTAKPTDTELAEVTHFFVNSLSITESYNAGDFERDGINLLTDLFQKHPVVFMVGGSGMYVKALCEGLDDMPEIDEELRESLNHQSINDYESLLNKLLLLDPEYYNQVDKANKQRVVRALEMCILTGKPFSEFRTLEKKERNFKIIKIGLEREREKLYQLIDQRMDLMLQNGLKKEAEQLLPFQNEYALQTIGYTEIFRHLEGAYDWDECERLLKRNSRRYAKKQLTWFKKDTDIHWLNVDQTDSFEASVQLINSQMNYTIK